MVRDVIFLFMKALFPALLSMASTLGAETSLRTEMIEYRQGETTLEGWLVYDGANSATRPGVLVLHQWKGVSNYEKKRAEMLARLGYVVFVADIYGRGVRPQAPEEARAKAITFKNNRALLRDRAKAGLEVLRQQKQTDPRRIAAIGYCFGGTAAIELARSGADISGVVSFHGGLDSPHPEDGGNIQCRILALQGADDPFVPPGDLAAFENEMRGAGVDWQLVLYGGAVHSFTDWDAGGDHSKGAAYNERADRRSWEAMRQFFAEIFS